MSGLRRARTRTLAHVVLVAALAVAALAAAHASAAEVEPTGIRPLAEPNDCVATGSVPACSAVAGMNGPGPFEFSSDGRTMYAALSGISSPSNVPYGGIARFDVDPATGVLTQPAAPHNCLWFDTVDAPNAYEAGCTTLTDASGDALGQIYDLELSPDGSFLYAAARTITPGKGGIYWFSRETAAGPSYGNLTWAGCGSVGGVGGCTSMLSANINGASDLDMSPDGKHLYVTGDLNKGALTTFARNTSTGALTQVDCHTDPASVYASCTDARGIDQPSDVLVSADGSKVYVSGYTSDGIAIFDRDATTGALTQVAGLAGCITATGDSTPGTGAGTCTDGRGLDGAIKLAIAPDADSLYVAADNADAIAMFDLAASGVPTQLAGTAGCVSRTDAECIAADVPDSPSSLVVSRDDRSVYVTSYSPAAVVGFDRTAGQTPITRSTDASTCVQPATSSFGACTTLGSSTFSVLDPSHLAISPSGHHLYFGSFPVDVINVLERPGSAPTCSVPALTIAANAAATTTTPTCSDLDSDTITYSTGTAPTHGTLGAINSSTGAISYQPAAGYAGSDSFTIVAADAFRSTTITVPVTVTGTCTSCGGTSTGGDDGTSTTGSTDTTRPRIRFARLRPRTFRVGAALGTSVRYSLTEPARVRLVLHRKVGTRLLRVSRTRTFARNRTGGRAGANAVRFTGYWFGRRLPAGVYRFSLVATDAAGNTSTPARVFGTITR